MSLDVFDGEWLNSIEATHGHHSFMEFGLAATGCGNWGDVFSNSRVLHR